MAGAKETGTRERHSAEVPLALVLIGVSGSGKTVVGQHLAAALGAAFLDADDYHPAGNVAKMHAGVPLDDADRWPWLAEVGRAVADQVGQGSAVVVACSALKRVYRRALETAARRSLTFIHLTVDLAELEARLQMRAGHFMPASLLTSQLATMEPLAVDEDGTALATRATPQQTADAIARWMRRRGPLSPRAPMACGDDSN